MTSEDLNPMESWLLEYVKLNVRQTNRSQFKTFLAWVKKTPKQLIQEFDKVKTRNMVLQYQNYLVNEKKLAQNTTRTYVNTVRAFFSSQVGETLRLKGKIVKIERPTDEHRFSLQDLQAMFSIANTRDKAILSLACSLGWESSLIRNIEKDFIENLIKRARSQEQDFTSFKWQRKKTGARIFGILTPMAIHCLEQYISRLDPDQKKLFPLSGEGLNLVLRNLVKESGIVTIGKIRFHLIRKWLFTSLSNAGLNEFECKLIIGKKIPLTDSTYLDIEKSAFEKYKKAYVKHLSLSMQVNGKAKYDEILDLIVKKVKADKALYDCLEQKGLLEAIPQSIQDQLKEVEEFAKIMEKKNGEKPKEEKTHERREETL